MKNSYFKEKAPETGNIQRNREMHSNEKVLSLIIKYFLILYLYFKH